jgi:hypothetical protein
MKDVKITSTGIIRNVVHKVERFNRDSSSYWVKTDDFDEDKYDFAVDLASMSEGARREF